MIELSDSITISRSSSEVFAFVADPANIPRWEAEVVTLNVVTPGPTRVGTRFTEELKMGPLRSTAQCEVTEFVAGKRMGFRAASSALTYQGHVLVEASPGGCKLTITGNAQLKWWARWMQPLMRGEFESGIRKELAVIKSILEGAPMG